jgi:hypothetical protein
MTMARKTANRQRSAAGARMRRASARKGARGNGESRASSGGRRNEGSRREGSRRGLDSRRGGKGSKSDAIALLKADHRQVETWFREFEKSNSDGRKQDLADRICAALKAHTTIEEEIFYPAFLEATGEEDIHHEAEIEHAGAKNLIAEIEASGPEDDHFDARIAVLSEMIKHHVNEEEKRGGMFAKARQSEMDLEELGRQLEARKGEVMGAGTEGSERRARPQARPVGNARANRSGRPLAQQGRRTRARPGDERGAEPEPRATEDEALNFQDAYDDEQPSQGRERQLRERPDRQRGGRERGRGESASQR